MQESLNNKVGFSSPSNIAFVKYWGKHGRQLPMNPSISMSLSNCVTTCEVDYFIDKKEKGIIEFKFEGDENEKFRLRMQNYLDSISDIYPLSKKLSLKISTRNTFPHSAGIASSASAMGAFASCLAQIEKKLLHNDLNFEKRASELARLASGSACRSIYPGYVIWGKTKMDIGSDDYACELKDVHPDFRQMCDSILIVSAKEKSVSSSHGHSLMNTHLYKEVREYQAHENMRTILSAIKNGDFETFGEILENEALTLHALMMTSYPSFILLEPDSLRIIELIKELRHKYQIPMYFTIDAGPNIHLIYPKASQREVLNLVAKELSPFCENVIHDEIGLGTKSL
jgi:diphosphomevalonate decarboxylase